MFVCFLLVFFVVVLYSFVFLDRKLGLYISFSSLLLRQEDNGEKEHGDGGEGEGDRFIKLILRAI